MDETELFETLVAGLLEYIHGDGQQGIAEQLREAQDPEKLAEVIGHITYSLVDEAAKQAEKKKSQVDFDILLGVATEMIDALIRMAQALKLPADDHESLGEQALLHTVQTYLMVADPSEDEKAAALEALQEMQGAGVMQEGAMQLQALGQKYGVDPFADVEQEPQQNPMAQGVQRGLMTGAQP